MGKIVQYVDYISHLYGKDVYLDKHERLARAVTFQVTDDCTACCTYRSSYDDKGCC